MRIILNLAVELTNYRPVCSEFVDELPELDEIYSTNPKDKVAVPSDAVTPQSRRVDSPTGSTAASIHSEDPTFAAQSSAWTPRSLYSATQIASPSKRRRTNDSDRSSFHSPSNPSFIPFHQRSHSFVSSPPIRQEDAIDSLLRAADFSEQGGANQSSILDSPSHGQLQPYDTPGIWPHADIQEACLMRYFIDELACWVSFPSPPPVHFNPSPTNHFSSICVTQNGTSPLWFPKEHETVPLSSTPSTQQQLGIFAVLTNIR
jgi:hypothetical protein